VTISLLLARTLLGSALPLAFDSSIDRQHADKLVESLQHRLATGTEPDTQSFRYFYDFLQTREQWQDWVRLASRLAFTPSVKEWNAVRMPNSLFPLYRAVRLGRLAARICGI
jgi:hypothetical protein